MSGLQVFDIIVGIIGLTGLNGVWLINLIKKKKMSAKTYKPYVITSGVIFGLSLFIYMIFFIPWSKFHYGDQPVRIIYRDTSNGKKTFQAKIIDNSSTNKDLIKRPIKEYKSEVSSVIKPRLKPNTDVQKDTSKSDTYDLKGATLTNSAIGRNPTVNNFNETHLDDEEKKREINSIGYYKQLWNVTNDTIVISHTQNSNGAVFQYEMSKFLRESGYPVMELNGWTVSKQPIIGVEIQKEGDKLNFIIGTLVKK